MFDATTLAAKLEANSVPEPNTGCRLWLGGHTKAGYGRVGLGRRGVSRYAHQAAYELAHGPIPPRLCVLHHCDQPCCIEPSHLFLGTQADNSRDMVAKGRNFHVTHPERVARGDRTGARKHPELMPRGERHGWHLHPELVPRGEQNGNSKLTADSVREIRRLAAAGENNVSIARQFNITREQTWNLVTRRQWKWLTD